MRSIERSLYLLALLACAPAITFAQAAGRLVLDPQGTNYVAEAAGSSSPSSLDRTSFTAEAWVRVAAPALSPVPGQQSFMAVLSDGAYDLRIAYSSFDGGTFNVVARVWYLDANGTLVARTTNTGRMYAGEWTHVAVAYDASTNRCFAHYNGFSYRTNDCLPPGASPATSYDQLFGIGLSDAGNSTGSRAPRAGSHPELRNAFNGAIDEVRISSVSRYGDTFTRPRVRLAADPNTLALWHFDEAPGATTFTNAATGGRSLTGVALSGSAGPATVRRGGAGYVHGDLNGDERSDIVWRLEDGRNYAWLLTESSGGIDRAAVLREGSFEPSVNDPNWRVAGEGDFDGDGLSDLLWRHSTGQVYAWFLDGRQGNSAAVRLSSALPLPRNVGNWEISASGDFDRDGRDDLVLRDPASGALRIWYLAVSQFSATPPAVAEGALPTVSDLDWRIVGSGDCNGDGSADLIWRRADGRHYVWNVDGRGPSGGNVPLVSFGALPPLADQNWWLAGVGDFNGDGRRCDLLWRNRADGRNVIWHVDTSNARLAADGTFPLVSGGVLPTVAGSAWTVRAVGEFDGDGQTDILWQHEDRRVVIWYAQGGQLDQSGLIPLGSRPGALSACAPSVALSSSCAYAVSVAVTGLASGATAVLQVNGAGNLTVRANGTFAFPVRLPSGSTYAVSILSQPANPSQTCTIAQGAGTVGTTDIANVRMACQTNRFTVGGTVTGLQGSGLVLRNRGGDDLAITGDGPFTFQTPVDSGSFHAITVNGRPRAPDQVCIVSNGAANGGGTTGPVGSGPVTSVRVKCATMTFATLRGSATAAGLHLVVAGDGYTASEPDKLRASATATIDRILDTPEIRAYSGAWNVHLLTVASSESGVDVPSERIAVDTFFDGTLDCGGTARLLCVNSGGTQAVVSSVFPAYSALLVLSNTPRYGGAGGTVATASVHPSSADIAHHEMGHSFAGLADEYVDSAVAGTSIGWNEATTPNVTAIIDLAAVKWRHWFANPTAVPRSPGEAGVGLFEGAAYRPTGLYRPTDNSFMRTLAREMGPVNAEAWVLSIYRNAGPVGDVQPQGSSVAGPAGVALPFTVTPRFAPPLQKIAWFENGIEIPAAAGSTSYRCCTTLVGNISLSVKVTESSGSVRIPVPNVAYFEKTWRVQFQ